MQDLAASVPVREVEGDHVDARERAGERVDRRVVRPVADPDEQRSLVEPQRVAALDEHGREQLEHDGDTGRGEDRRERRRARRGAPPSPAGGALRPASPTSTGS